MLTDNLVAGYKLDESSGNATDSSGNSFTLINNNSVSYSAFKINNGADLGASNTNKSLSIANNLGITGGNFTCSMFVKLNTEISTSSYSFFRQFDGGTDVGYSIMYEYNGGTRRLFFARLKQGVAYDGPVYNITLGTGNTYHLFLVYNGTNVEGFVNNVSIGTAASSGNGTSALSSAFELGCFEGNQRYSSSKHDEVYIWSRALTSDERATVYNSGNGLQYPFTVGNPSAFFQFFS